VAKVAEVIAVVAARVAVVEEEDTIQALLAAAAVVVVTKILRQDQAMTILLADNPVARQAGVRGATYRSKRILLCLLCLKGEESPATLRHFYFLRLEITQFSNRHLRNQKNFIGQISFCSYFFFGIGKNVSELETSVYNNFSFHS
jgi:hypothetical protein